MSETRYQTFDEFWPYYLGEHLNPACRALHYVGTGLVIGTAVTSLVTMNPTLLLALPVIGYGFAWVGHYAIEKNRPATFTYPRWSLAADFKMFGYFVTGRMGAELAKHHPGAAGAARPQRA
jgi:hypothetical protein